MKSSLLISLFLSLFFFFSVEAAFDLSKEMEDYNNAINVEKDIVFHKDRKLDVYYPKGKEGNKKVIIFILGSSYITGDKFIYTNFGSLLQDEDYVAVIPNYILFPNGTIEDMVDDVYNAIQWTYKNISKYGGNPETMTLSAHSSGAHISSLTVIKSTLGIENNGKILEKLPRFEKVVLIDGPYIFDDEFIQYTLQGTGSTSSATITQDAELQALLQQLMMKYYNDESISSIALLKKQEKNSVKFNVGKFILFYGGKDNVVPESSSKGLLEQIMRTSKISFEYVYDENAYHATITDGVRAGDENAKKIYMDLVRF